MATTKFYDRIVFVCGELDSFSSIEVGQRLEAFTGEVTILDLTGISFISSAGLRCVDRFIERTGCAMMPSPVVQRLLALIEAPPLKEVEVRSSA